MCWIRNIQAFKNPVLFAIGFIIVLVVSVIVAVWYMCTTYSSADLSAYGSIFSAGGSFIAAILFLGSLWYQAQQLKEQRIQFSSEFRHLQNAAKREALLMAKTILDTAVDQAVMLSDGIASSVVDIGPNYLFPEELKILVESSDPEEVLLAYKSWTKRELPALELVRGVKSAAMVYLQSVDAKNIDYTLDPEDFINTYGNQFLPLPFFNAYEGPMIMLCPFMQRLKPGRNAATIAQLAAMLKSGIPYGMVKIDLLKAEIKKQIDASGAIPRIAKELFPDLCP